MAPRSTLEPARAARRRAPPVARRDPALGDAAGQTHGDRPHRRREPPHVRTPCLHDERDRPDHVVLHPPDGRRDGHRVERHLVPGHREPRARVWARSRRRVSGSVMVYGVYAGSPRSMIRSTRESGANASSALPTPVGWSGRRPPTRDTMGTERWPRMRSTMSASVPSRTASWTFSASPHTGPRGTAAPRRAVPGCGASACPPPTATVPRGTGPRSVSSRAP